MTLGLCSCPSLTLPLTVMIGDRDFRYICGVVVFTGSVKSGK